MSRAFDLRGREYWIEEVQRYCLSQLDLFTPRSAFGWPMDRISDQPYGYAIHTSIVRDWNKENRETERIKFHRSWLENEDNIKKALERIE